MSERARLLLKDYNTWRDHTNHAQQLRTKFTLRQLKETKDRLALFESMAQWCDQKSLDPRLWLYSLFQSRRWLYAPKLTLAHLRSTKNIPRYHALKSTSAFQTLLRSEHHVAQVQRGDVFDSHRDLSTTTEYRKQRYHKLGMQYECMHDVDCHGYHPKSLVCSKCSVAKECYLHLQAQVPFDILSLRKGEMTIGQAKFMGAYKRE